MLSTVATRRNADSRSGASVPRARQAPLNSSMPAIKPRISGEIWRESVRIMQPIVHPFTPKTPDIHSATYLHPFRRTRRQGMFDYAFGRAIKGYTCVLGPRI